MHTVPKMQWILQDRGRRGLCLERVYRYLYNPELHLASYGKIYRNNGAMTKGTTQETVDGMSFQKIQRIIDCLRDGRYRWTPVRRIYILKKNGKQRPLGLPTWSDKLVQESIRTILEWYYEPQFSDSSCGFRPRRGCHTALNRIAKTWTGASWFIEGDISGCFDNINHEILLNILREKIHDGRFIDLISGLLKSGYLEDWKYNATLSGSPQGGIVSPILANIYLDRLDKFVEQVLLPDFNRGTVRRTNQAYHNLQKMAARRKKSGDVEGYRECMRKKGLLPSKDFNDPNYRRLRYVRYADDFLLGFCGPKQEAEEIKDRLRDFLQESLKLNLSPEKTLITHARTQKARFLGYEICVSHNNLHRANGVRRSNGKVCLLIPSDVINDKISCYLKHGKISHRPELLPDQPLSIVARYQAEWRGLVEYYQLAWNMNARLGRLFYFMNVSLAKTLACKYQISRKAVFDRFKSEVETPLGMRKVLLIRKERPDKPDLVAYFGGINLARTKIIRNCDPPLRVPFNPKCELVERLLADECELCGRKGACEVHHIRKLADIDQPGRRVKPDWVKRMIARRRKTLVVCLSCHQDIHNGRYDGKAI